MTMESKASQATVYIVDDEPVVRRALKQSVESLGVFVMGFENAPECLDLIRHVPCNLVITDVNMPGMDGLELLQIIREEFPMIPVLMMSGYADIPLAVRAVKE